CFFMGEFFAESLIFAETANSVGAIQVASSTEITQTPFFIASCDYVLIGEEFYAASAYLTRQPVLVGSLIGQDWTKLAIMAFIIVGTVINSGQRMMRTSDELQPDGSTKPMITDRFLKPSETSIGRMFAPRVPVGEMVPRQPDPSVPKPVEGGN
ncbi:MAG: DUF6754 domain-containing protein, partial [Fimbriimonadaceae bacterium]